MKRWLAIAGTCVAVLFNTFPNSLHAQETVTVTTEVGQGNGQEQVFSGFLWEHNPSLEGIPLVGGSISVTDGNTTISEHEDSGYLQSSNNDVGYISHSDGSYFIWFATPPESGSTITFTYQYQGQAPDGQIPSDDGEVIVDEEVTPSEPEEPIVVDEPETPPTNPEEPIVTDEPETPTQEPEEPIGVDEPETPTDTAGTTGLGLELADKRDGLPAVLMGQFPIDMPEYNNIEQLIVLSNQWVVLVTNNLDKVSEEIAKLVKDDPEWSHIDFVQKQKDWDQSTKDDNPNWWLLHHEIEPQVERYQVEARERAGERLLDDPNYFTITSSDGNYGEEHPLRVARFLISLGYPEHPGFDPHYNHVSYLEMPSPMQDGNSYTITLGDGKSVTFNYDEMKTVSRGIKINQVGYLPNAEKVGFVGAYLQNLGPMEIPVGAAFKVINADTGAEVHSGAVELRYENPRFAPKGSEDPNSRPLVSGENIYSFDFTPVTEPGTYFVSIEGVGRSWPFTVGNAAYAEAFWVAARGLFHQRCGIGIDEPYSFWPRVECHTDPVYENDYIPIFFFSANRPNDWHDFDIVGGTVDFSKSTADATGGWHDAGDWDKRIMHYTNVFDLLALYDFKRDAMHDDQLNIPESGNGIPDVLDEAEYGLLVWKKSMDENGGVAGRLETNTHPTIDDPDYPYSYSKRTRWSSLLYAAAAAYYAHLVKDFDEAKYDEYLSSAQSAYAFGTNPENSLGTITIHPKRKRGSGEEYSVTYTEDDYFNIPFLIAAKTQLFAATEDETYLEGLEDLLNQAWNSHQWTNYKGENKNSTLRPAEWPFSKMDVSMWLYHMILDPALAAYLPPETIDQWKGHYINIADSFEKLNTDEYYHRSRELKEDKKMEWGYHNVTNFSRILLFAHHLTGDEKYLQAAEANANYMLGANATGMVWTTGIGYVYPVPIHHRYSSGDDFDVYDPIRDPVPGIAIYGPTEQHLRDFDNMWLPKDANGNKVKFLKPEQYTDVGKGDEIIQPRLRNWAPHPVLDVKKNEFTVHETQSANLFTYGYLIMDDNWQAPEWVKNRRPRDPKLLFGQWYLP